MAPLSRAQNALTNLQMTGRFSGIGRRTFVVTGDGDVEVAVDAGAIVVRSSSGAAVLANAGGATSELPAWIEPQPTEIAKRATSSPGRWIASGTRSATRTCRPSSRPTSKPRTSSCSTRERSRRRRSRPTSPRRWAKRLARRSVRSRSTPRRAGLRRRSSRGCCPRCEGKGSGTSRTKTAFYRQPRQPAAGLSSRRSSAAIKLAQGDARLSSLCGIRGAIELEHARRVPSSRRARRARRAPDRSRARPTMMKRVVGGLERWLPGAARRVRHDGRWRRVPAAKALRATVAEDARRQRRRSARGPRDATVPDEHRSPTART
jgi:hypothetical protein